jgi:peptidoglycan/xylan/chitin deacetylase (PgdA/CDA1 family)
MVLLGIILVGAIFIIILFGEMKHRITILSPLNQHVTEDIYAQQEKSYDPKIAPSEHTNVISNGPRDKKRIAITFDAEMTESMRKAYLSGKVKSSYDKEIVNTLNQTQTKATFFLTGMWIELYPNVTKELATNPLFELGSHSYTDSSYHGFCYGLHVLPNAMKTQNIERTEQLLKQYTGVKNKLFRFPGGCYAAEDIKLVNQVNDIIVHWDIVGGDGFNKNTNQIIHNITDHLQNGSIIVLHVNGAPTAPKTAKALPTIISILKTQGYEFVKVNELLDSPSEK